MCSNVDQFRVQPDTRTDAEPVLVDDILHVGSHLLGLGGNVVLRGCMMRQDEKHETLHGGWACGNISADATALQAFESYRITPRRTA